MYPSIRRHEARSIGVWKFAVGRPTSESTQKWVQRCNFVFRTVYKIQTLPDNEGNALDTDKNCGWIIELEDQTGAVKECYISTEHASSNTVIRKRLMSALPGVICRITSDDFLKFVDEDSKDLDTIHVSGYCGKVGRSASRDERSASQAKHVWAFPSIILNAKGEKMSTRPVFVSNEFLQRRSNGDMISLPAKMPMPRPLSTRGNALTSLSRRMRAYYGPRLPHALHLLTSVLKGIHFDTLLQTEHFVSIANISGPPNVGKTFACAIALSFSCSEGLMLSRCTPSAMIDKAHIFKNMLIVWDDPRDCTHAQLSTIVHEAFHGHATSTITRGLRKYNSSLIIGTQEHMLGMPYNSNNLATFSRLSHINMSHPAVEWEPDAQSEASLQEKLPANADIFAQLLSTQYDAQEVDRLQERLGSGHIISRCLRITAIDWYFARVFQKCGFEIDSRELNHYFAKNYMDYLSMHCSRMSPVEHLCRHVKQMMLDEIDIPSVFFKPKVTIDLKQFGPSECFALYPKDFMNFLYKIIPEAKTYTKEQLHAQLKNSKYGEVSRNVAFRSDAGTQIRRALVVRRSFLNM